MENKQEQQVKKVIDFLLRRKKIIFGCMLICVISGIGVYLNTPKTYEATALLKYQQQSINPTSMSPDSQERLRDIVSTLSEQITSRTSLEKLILQFDLYRTARERQPMEDVVAKMKKRDITIRPLNPGDIFMVSFQGSDPKKVSQVTNALASKFVEENIRFREERVTETSAYIKDELRMAKQALDKKDEALRDYKLKYYNELPQQLAHNINRLSSLQTQYQDNQSNIQNLEQTRLLIQEQISLRKDIQSKITQQSSDSMSDKNVIYKSQDPVADLAQMKMNLEILRSRYTDKHPEIKRLKKIIQSREEGLKNRQNIAGDNSDNISPLSPVEDSQLVELQRQLKEIENSITSLKSEKVAIQNDINKYQKWVEAVPFREAEWSALTRNYNQLSKHYDSLVAQSLSAESAESLERKQKGSQFKIIDPAHLPEKPAKPDFIKIMLLAILLGLACGCGISYSLEFLDTTFKDASEIESYLGIPIVCSIPIIHTDKERQKKKIQSVLWALTFIVPTLVLVGGVIYLRQKGIIII